jgi:hypothetical protein
MTGEDDLRGVVCEAGVADPYLAPVRGRPIASERWALVVLNNDIGFEAALGVREERIQEPVA